MADFDRATAAEVNRPPQYVSYAHGPHLSTAVLAGKAGWPEYETVRLSASGQARWNQVFLALAAAVLAARDHDVELAERSVVEFHERAEPFPLAYHLGLRLLGEVAVDWGEPVRWLRTAEAYFTTRAPLVAEACRELLNNKG
ncbi:hypothetical protein ACFQ1S_11390 [Kibdelosporangium lantanae]|uniref:Uncharacterized protein n=1 Tax=Kibdelosporangium lantanae TaxID=1497396 RepID=A0ABW3M999_9PSEU